MSGLYKLKTLDELMTQIELGMDIEFYMSGTRYNISWRDDKPFVCECPDGDAVFYDSPGDMFNNHKIKGNILKDIWKDFEIISM